MKFNFRKVSAILTSGAMAVSAIGVAAAANYPAPFVVGGSADVAVVHGTGEGVSYLDVVEAGNIQTNLQSFLTGSGGVTTFDCGAADCVILAKSSDNLNIGDTFGVFTGSVTDEDLSNLLADGTYIADDNDEFDYEQKISLGTPSLSHFRDSDYETLIGASVKTPVVGFRLTSNTYVLNYTLDFLQDAESDIVSGDMDDIEGSDITLLGKTYYVSDLKNGTSATVLGKMTLLDSATTASVSEGETVTVDGHEVSISYIDNDEVRFLVDGELAPSSGKLTKGGSYKLSDGSYIGVRDISKLEVSGEIGTVSFSIGSGKLEMTSGSNIKLNDKTIQGVKAWVYQGTGSSGSEKIDKIVIEWRVDDESFLTPESELLMPGFEAVKFTMNELVRPTEEVVTLAKSDDQKMELKVPIKDGTVSIGLLYGNSTGDFIGIGEDAENRLVTTSGGSFTFTEKNATSGDNYDAYFVASYNISQEAQSYLLRAKVSEDTDAGRNETTIEKYDGSAWVEVCTEKTTGDTCNIGDVSLTISTIAYTSGGAETVVINRTSTSVNFNTIYTTGGLKIWLPYEAASVANASNGVINFTTAANTSSAGHSIDSFYVWFDAEDKDDNIASGNSFYMTVDDTSDNKFQVSNVNGTGTGGSTGLENEAIGDAVYEAYMPGDVATRLLHYTKADEDWAEVYYPTGDSETYAEVFLTESGAIVSGGAATTGAQLGDVIVKDTEVSSVSTKNLIIIGGSCINSAAASALGLSGATCGAAFTTATGVGSGEFLIKGVSDSTITSKLALVVAGYNAADTVNAAKYLRTQTVDTSKEYKGTSSTSAELVVTV